MKVLFLSNIPVPYRMNFFNELGKYCDLTVLMEASTVPHLNNSWLKAFKVENFKYIVLPSLFSGKEIRINYRLMKYIKKNKYDIIIIGGYSSFTGMVSILILNLLKIPYILNCDGGIVKKDAKIMYFLKKYFISSASAWLSTSDKTTEYLVYYGAKRESIYKFPFTSIYHKDILKNKLPYSEKLKIKKELGIKEEKIILSVGQFIHRKGFDVLIKSIPNFKENCGVYIVGGRPTKEYTFLKDDLGIHNLNFIEFKDKEELIKFYSVADIFILPTREDIWGLVINEAMSFGLPIITTENCIAGLELVENDINGYIIPVDDVTGISEKINILLDDEIKCSKMKINNLKKIEKYTIENMAVEHIKIFKSILSNT